VVWCSSRKTVVPGARTRQRWWAAERIVSSVSVASPVLTGPTASTAPVAFPVFTAPTVSTAAVASPVFTAPIRYAAVSYALVRARKFSLNSDESERSISSNNTINSISNCEIYQNKALFYTSERRTVSTQICYHA
jgi:outer membrane receptor protein involved in Fe transport